MVDPGGSKGDPLGSMIDLPGSMIDLPGSMIEPGGKHGFVYVPTARASTCGEG
jgi:hypothetical protein